MCSSFESVFKEVNLNCLLRFNILLNDITFRIHITKREYALSYLTKKLWCQKPSNANLIDKIVIIGWLTDTNIQLCNQMSRVNLILAFDLGC